MLCIAAYGFLISERETFSDGLAVGDLSPLTPILKLQAAQDQYNAIAARANLTE